MFLITSASVTKAPNSYPKEGYKIFLGGVIDGGKAELWQDVVIEFLKDYEVVVLSPRRDDWDSSWKQTLDDERFVEQVEWELEGQETADINLYCFGADEKQAKKKQRLLLP